MAGSTVKTILNLCNPNNAWSHLRRLQTRTADSAVDIGFGTMLASMSTRPARERTGLTSQVAHVHDEAPFGLTAVYVTAGTPLAIVSGAAPGAGEVRVEIDAVTAVPTFTFNAVTTSYFIISGGPLPQNLAAVMAEKI